MTPTNGKSYSFSFKVTQIPQKGQNNTPETALNNTKDMAFWALVRALASNPPQFLALRDGGFRDFRDLKATEKMSPELRAQGIVYRIEIVDIKL